MEDTKKREIVGMRYSSVVLPSEERAAPPACRFRCDDGGEWSARVESVGAMLSCVRHRNDPVATIMRQIHFFLAIFVRVDCWESSNLGPPKGLLHRFVLYIEVPTSTNTFFPC